jgi:hypothetical protein
MARFSSAANTLARATIDHVSPALAACVFLGVAFAPDHVAAENALERAATRGAIGLFRQAVLPSEPMPTRCGLRKEWLNYSITKGIGRRYFGLAIHADLLSPYYGTRPERVIDPDGRMPDAFCTEDEAKQEWNKLVPGSMEAQPGGEACNAPGWLHQKYTQYSFPVFSADYRRAAIVVMGTDVSWIATSTVDAKRCGADSGVAARLRQARRGMAPDCARATRYHLAAVRRRPATLQMG